MKTTAYNPSDLEVEFANALEKLQDEIGKHLNGTRIVAVDCNLRRDNPMVRFSVMDKDGDPHEVVIRVIQIPDKF